MRRVLVVAPHFPPVSAPDGQRARLSVSHFAEFGWEPYVLTVDPAAQTDIQDPLLSTTLPAGLPVTAVPALPVRWTRPVGVGNVALRALPYLYRAGRDLITRHDIDLVYFSTTMFAAMPLGRLWKRALGVPYILDIQDPWLSDAAERRPGIKARMAGLMHAVLEPYTMRAADGLVAVSGDYIATLRRRYPWIEQDACATIPFGAAASDFDVARRLTWTNPFFATASATIQGVSVGRGGRDMQVAARILFRAFADASAAGSRPARLSFIGTDYAPAGRGLQSLLPIAIDEGAGQDVFESTDRIGYLEGLRVLGEADFLIVLGSDDPQYSPSKVYPYLLAGRPVLSVLHESSPVVDLMRRARFGPVVTFRSKVDIADAARRLAAEWPAFLADLDRPRTPSESWVRGISARDLTRAQCDLFSRVLQMRDAHATEVTCRG